MKKSVLKIRSTVEALLEFYPHLRDDDNKLIASIWYQQSQDAKTKDQFLTLLSSNKLASPESIRRSRQLIQEQNPHLRGLKWEIRKHKAEPEMRDMIRDQKKSNLKNQ